MSFLDKLFGKKTAEVKTDISKIESPECKKILELCSILRNLLNSDHYVARSEYKDIQDEYKSVIDFFSVLSQSGMLSSFCSQNYVSEPDIHFALDTYNSLIEKVDMANDKFINRKLIEEKDYLDNILHDVDPVIILDEDQRKVILTDEDYCLIVAGAGAGKTTTVAAKVKYLIEKKNIDPKDILVISFTNKAVGELQEKINKDLKIDCPIATFHSTGNAILHINSDEQMNIVSNAKLYYLLQNYFKDSILKNETLVNNLILFFASYIDAPYEGDDLNEFFNKTAKSNFTTLRSDLEDYKKNIIDARTKKNVTIQNEILKSHQEVEIANFLYLNNIDYEYEPIYPFNINYSRKPYTPDFIIKQGDNVAYIEHFGITEDGLNYRYTEDELTRYKNCINDKVKVHRAHGTKLIYTFSSYNDSKSLLTHLQEGLEKQGFILKKRPNKEVMEKIIASEESRYIRSLVSLICRFIGNFKTNGYGLEEFDTMYRSTTNVRSRLFLTICRDCFLEYERYLKDNSAVDFEDMINNSARILREVKEMKQRLNFKYIIVDEYQDISRQRFDLTTALSDVTDAKIIAVGDDWQSIYAFSGSDISLFTKFEEKMGYAKQLKIVRTYRNSQDVIDIAGNFIQRNTSQIQKQLLSPKTIDDPVIIYTYDDSYKKENQVRQSGALYAQACAIETALEQIMDYNRAAGKKEDGSILLLGRFGFDGDHLERSGLFENKTKQSKIKSVKYPHLNITFMTVHASKGLGYDNVIVVNGKNDTYGFPSKIQDDPVLSFVIKGDHSIDYAEERRLFYVAMTRTKNRVYFIAPESNPSEFLLEIKQNYKNVVLKGNWNEEAIKITTAKKSCPICGYPMQFRYKNSYGLRLYMCTNDPEICGFMTNDIKAKKLSIMKCDKCATGYLIVKKANGKYFLGCTNFTADKKGCNNTISGEDYYSMMNFKFDPTDIIAPAPEKKTGYVPKHDEIKSINIIQPIVTPSKNNNTTDALFFPDYNNSGDIHKIFYKNYCLYNLINDILSCLNNISQKHYYGITILIATLRGGDRKQMQTDNLKSVPEYGLYSNMKRDDMRCTVQWLIDNNYILQTKEYYKKLHITYNGNHFAETITESQLKKLKKYLENPNREVFIEEEDNQ